MNTIRGMRGRVAVEEARRRRQNHELQQLYSSESMKQRFEQLQGAIQAGNMGSYMQLLQEMIASASGMMGSGAQVPDDPRSMARNELMQASYDSTIAVFVDYTSPAGGFTIWDFEEIVAEASKIEVDQRSQVATVESKMDQTQIAGKAFWPFVKYLHYLGVFMAIEAREQCSHCQPDQGSDCEHCGGLGWIVRDPIEEPVR